MSNQENYWLKIAQYDLDTADSMLKAGRYLYVGFSQTHRSCKTGHIPYDPSAKCYNCTRPLDSGLLEYYHNYLQSQNEHLALILELKD